MTNTNLDRKEQIILEVNQLVDRMYDDKEQSCISCCEKITEKYAEELEPLMKEYEELEFGDRIISSPNKSHKGDA